MDVGNLWDTGFDIHQYDGLIGAESILDYSKADTYRASTGISLQWLSPMGPLVISLSKLLTSQPGDRKEGFSFNVGQTF